MEKATEPDTVGQGRKRSRRRRGPKRDRDAVTAERVLKATVPAGSRFKGYEDYLVRELHLAAEVIRDRRERWATPSGETVVAALPLGTVGGCGPELRRFVLALHAQGQVTAERLTALLEGIGMAISKRQVVRLLAAPLGDLVAEDEAVLRAREQRKLLPRAWRPHAGSRSTTPRPGTRARACPRAGPRVRPEAGPRTGSAGPVGRRDHPARR